MEVLSKKCILIKHEENKFEFRILNNLYIFGQLKSKTNLSNEITRRHIETSKNREKINT